MYIAPKFISIFLTIFVYHLISKSNVQKTHFDFSFCMTLFIQFFERNQLHPFIRLRIESAP